MSSQNKIEQLSKVADIVNKKMIVLLAVDGGIGAYAVKYIEQNNVFGYLLGFIFIIITIGLVYNYDELNRLKKEIEVL